MAAALVCGALFFGFIIVLTRVLYKAFLMDKIHTEASQREREDQSATTTTTMMNLEEVGREFERSVIDEGQGILVDKIHMEASQREREDQSATTTSKMMNSKEVGREFKISVIDEGQEILKRLDDLLGQTIYLGLNQTVPTRSLQRLHAPLVVKESDVVGRDGDKKKIIELLFSADTSRNNLSVIPIVGMAGIGKTTLAQLVYKDCRVQQHFDFKVWVTVSEEFDVFQITKLTYKKVTSQECIADDIFELQTKLNEALAGKRFLFVLDDVWNENYGRWDSLKSGFQSGAHGSTIIVTTRSKVVASTMTNVAMHRLNLVSVDDCWQIFVKHAFVDNQAQTEELQKLGLDIVKRCKGLPLAVKSVAGLLRSTSNPEEWRQILDSDIWQLQFQENLKNNIVPALWLSYHFLPPVLKRCFAYCSIFPKDYEFEERDMEKIIWLWMAEGLLTPEKGKRMEDIGKAYLQALISRSFFQQSSRWESGMVMHDLVHDLAMFISGEFCFSCGDSNDLSNLGTKSCHLSYRKDTDDLMKLGAVSQSREKKPMSLRTLLALPLSCDEFVQCNKPVLELHELFLKVGGCLRVLSLPGLRQITELPDSIGNMKYLRYLNLSHTKIKELPDFICTFYNLQTLLLSCCYSLKRLPTRLAALVNLHHLDIRSTSLKELPDSICTLYNLQTLLLSCCYSLKRLPTRLAALVNLRHLDIRSTSLKELPDSICTLYNLQTLLLSSCQYLERLPTRLAAMVNLRHLDISYTSLKELPDSICTLYNLQTLLLSHCKQLTQLPTRLASLVNLRHLDIRGTPLKEMPPRMCKIRRLSDFVLGEKERWRIKELGEFPLLEGKLRISGLEYIVDVKDVLEANLKDKKFLSELILEWGGDSNITSSQHEREVLEALQPHKNLKKLKISGYRGTIFPDWVGHESFCNMVQVGLRNCRNVCLLPPLGQLSSLRSVRIGGLDGVVSIGNEFCGSSSATTNHPFTSLEYLEFWGMKSWEEWSFSSDRLGQEGGIFPSLIELRICLCKKLIVGLPDCHLPSLKSIHIENCDEMVGVFVCQSCQEMDTNTFPSLELMYVWFCSRLESLLGSQSIPSNLKHLEIWGCKKLWENRTNWGLERLPSLMRLRLKGIEEEVDSFLEEGLLPTTLTYLSIRNFSKLKGLNGRAFQHLTCLQILEIGYCGELECLPQEGLPLSLSFLEIYGCPEVLKQRCQRGTGEDWPKIQHIPHIVIRESGQTFNTGHSTLCWDELIGYKLLHQVTNIFEQELQDHQRPLLRNIFEWLAIKRNYMEKWKLSIPSKNYHLVFLILIDEKRNPNDFTSVK